MDRKNLTKNLIITGLNFFFFFKYINFFYDETEKQTLASLYSDLLVTNTYQTK